ncbi:hypothetical protein DXV75_02605 [Alteromonas aestuariivivens]|uniref:Cellulase Ig-like domain-containing protein n=1 Tax=Alteromonas aestuariivivens TaxID=1938339 RepID=A0A3D8MEX5_9ALTE|nr:hypothetical protein [Alteromonas aestuariivivens]RDV29357.1 hypothetical protein DXV75_02605 [Alteromonas aestuariivivens]
MSRSQLRIALLTWAALFAAGANGTSELQLDQVEGRLTLMQKDIPMLQAPREGFWSVGVNAGGLDELNFLHAQISEVSQYEDWTVYAGRLEMEGGNWLLRDSCQPQEQRIKCIRRFEWQGTHTLEQVVLSVRWQSPSAQAKTFLPGLVYYGNPAAKKMDPSRIAHMSQQAGEFVQFEEHRFPMPFAYLEWPQQEHYAGAAVHSLPSAVARGNRADLWWSLGTATAAGHSEIRLLSGPVGFNRTADVVKLYQKENAPYPNATMQVRPGDVIEKTYYLQADTFAQPGSGFRLPMYTSMDIFQPFDTRRYPTFDEVVGAKLAFSEKRFMQGEGYSGFNMFDHQFRRQIVMGWAGQSDAPGYYLLALGKAHGRQDWIEQGRQALDFLTQAPFDPNQGFALRYAVDDSKWSHYDHVSQGQALYMFAKAIETGRQIEGLDTAKWEQFFLRGAQWHAQNILKPQWSPLSTNEGFLVAPLALGARLFDNKELGLAAVKAADHYAKRHLSMDEPYWGGTLDAKGEDKEGAWAGFQAFMAVYDLTGEQQYLEYAQHAAEVMLSYTVVWDIPMPAGRLSDQGFKSTGWTAVSPQNQHLDVYGVLTTPWLNRLGQLTNDARLQQLARVMYLSCGQLIAPTGEQGEQIQHTNFVQSKHNIKLAGAQPDPGTFRGGYSEEWTVLWITAHFLTAAALLNEQGEEW